MMVSGSGSGGSIGNSMDAIRDLVRQMISVDTATVRKVYEDFNRAEADLQNAADKRKFRDLQDKLAATAKLANNRTTMKVVQLVQTLVQQVGAGDFEGFDRTAQRLDQELDELKAKLGRVAPQ